MKLIIFSLLVFPLLSFADGMVVCQANQDLKVVTITDIVESETETDLLSYKLTARVLVTSEKTKETLREFTAEGSRELMAAGSSEELRNEAEGFSMEQAFNGSVLNSWHQPLTVKYKGDVLSCQWK